LVKFYDQVIEVCLWLEEIPKNHNLSPKEKSDLIIAETKLREWAQKIDEGRSNLGAIAREIKNCQEISRTIDNDVRDISTKIKRKKFMGLF
jgi:hypothetical protein